MTKKRKLYIGIIFIIIVIFAGVAYHIYYFPNTKLPPIVVNNIQLDSHKMNKQGYMKDKVDQYNIYDYHNMDTFKVTTVKNDQIVGLELLDNKPCCQGKNIKNIKLNDTKQQVAKKMDNRHYKVISSDRYGELMVYTDKEKKEQLAFALSTNDKVYAIIAYNYKLLDYQY